MIDATPLTRHQKLHLFRYGVCPRLSWPLTVEDLPITWLQRELQPLATKTLKKWTGMAGSSNTSILFLPAKRGGLALPSLVSLYKTMQATRYVQLVTSSDPGVRKVAELRLEEERRSQRRKFQPAQLVEELLSAEQPQSRCTVARVVKNILTEEEGNERHQGLCQLPAQGEMARSWEETSPDLWVKAVQGLPPEPLKFAQNASIDTLPTNGNLHTWGKKTRDTCTLCGAHRQSLLHVLNHCQVAMDLRRYSERHDEVLKVFGDAIKASLQPDFSVTINLPMQNYRFPHHITPTNMRPWWNDVQRELWLFELTISYDSLLAEARERKRAKYQDLVEAGRAAGYKTELTVEVGSRGILGFSDLEPLAAAISCSRKDIETLCLIIIRTTLLESFSIWCSRNTVT